MKLVDQVAATCRRLAPRGWDRLLALHGLRLDSTTLASPRRLAKELARPLTAIDRTVTGFEDFSPAGVRAIEPSHPERSLLYHAFASPLVHPFRDHLKNTDYPTLSDLDVIENYIYACAGASLKSLRENGSDGATLVVGVFAYHYRIGARSPNGKFADMTFARTGVARVGTRPWLYQAWRRSFWPVASGAPGAIAVMPARYGAFLAEWRTPCPDDSILTEQPGDDDRSFLFPVHKLFDGPECLKHFDLQLKFEELHRSEKLRRTQSEGILPLVDGFDTAEPPFVRQSDTVADLVQLQRIGSSRLVVPAHHPQLVRYAMQRNGRTKRTEIVRFTVPKGTEDNRFAESSFQYLDVKYSERRSAPEYVNIRHRVTDPTKVARVQDLNQLPHRQFSALMRAGGYEAAHFVDDTCEGCVTVHAHGLGLDEPDVENFAAYSLVCAPDFFPLVDQADVMEWIDNVLQRSGERDHFAQGGPRPLSCRRNCINPQLFRRSPSQVPASFVRSPADQSRTETLTAIVGASRSRIEGKAPHEGNRYRDPSTAFLPDAASGIFDPGWDVSFSGNHDADFLSSYGLGNPFPEDTKLCAALNSYWPAVAPDATRTFGLCPPEWEAATSIPLMDKELGYHPRHPLVPQKLVTTAPGWDGEYGPFFERGHRYVNHADIARSDYVTHALRRELSVHHLSRITPRDFFGRMNALRVCIHALPEDPKRVSGTPLFLVSARTIAEWLSRPERADPRLVGGGYLFEFAVLGSKPLRAGVDIGRVRRKVLRCYTCQVGALGVCWKREAPGQQFAFHVEAPGT